MPGLTYGSYLKIDELLALQQPQSDPPEHDELLFIIVHQVHELWFRQMLHEIEAAMNHLNGVDLLKAQKNFRRIHAIQRVVEAQVEVLETMTPQEFNAFRYRLDPASGFQSAQFREIEFLCGAQKTGYLSHLAPTGEERALRAPISGAYPVRRAQSSARAARLCDGTTRGLDRNVSHDLRKRRGSLRPLRAA